MILWKNKKQNFVLWFRAVSEYRMMTQSVCEIMWIRQSLMTQSLLDEI